jgi:hypothetical protein
LVAGKFFEISIQRPLDDPGNGNFFDQDFWSAWQGFHFRP